MRLLAQAGRPQDALRQFEACVRALREGLDAGPSPETTALRERIARGEIGRPRAAAAIEGWRRAARRLLGTERPPALRGRSAALEALEDLVRAGAGTLLLIGEAGVGKTRLAVEAARLAEAQGALILAGVSTSLEGKAPYAPFVDAWVDHQRVAGPGAAENPFVTFLPVQGAGPEEEKLRLFQRVERSLAEMGRRGAVLLLLDDVHEADESSLHLLHYLARATRTQPWTLVATLREEEIRVGTPLHTLLSNLHRERLARRLLVERLDRDATREVTADLLGRPPEDRFVLAVFRLTGGNPFYTEEVVRAEVESGRHQAAEPIVPSDLADVISDRVSRLGAEAEQTLHAASVVGLRFTSELLEAISGLPRGGARDALERCQRARLIEEDLEGYRFRHGLVREVLYATLSRARRGELHRAAAQALEAVSASTREAPVEALAHHHLAAGETRRALPHLITAARRSAARAGLGEATGFLEQALTILDELGEPSSPPRWSVLEELGEVRFRQGHYAEALSTWRRAIEICAAAGDSDDCARLFARSARATGWPGVATRQSLALCEEGLTAVGGKPGPGLASLLHEAARAHTYAGSLDRGLALSREALAMAAEVGAREAHVESLTTLGVILGEIRQGDEALRHLREAVRAAEQAALVYPAIRAHNNLASVLEEQAAQFAQSREHFRLAAALAEQGAGAAEQLYCGTNAARVSLWLAEVSAAEELLAKLRPLLARVGEGNSAVLQYRLSEALLWRTRGDSQEAARRLRACRASLGEQHEPSLLKITANCLAEVLLEQGAWEEAEQVLLDVLALKRGMGHSSVWSRCLASELLQRRGRPAEAQHALNQAWDEAGRSANPWEREHLALAEARLAASEGAWDRALKGFGEAARVQAETGKRWHRARTLEEWAGALEGRGGARDPGSARALRQEAAEIRREIQ
jgi:tetratricopeptide (TPR) repeat protein